MPFPSSLLPAGWAFRSKDRTQHQSLEYALDCRVLWLRKRTGLSLSSLRPQVSRLDLEVLEIVAINDFTDMLLTENHMGIKNHQKPHL